MTTHYEVLGVPRDARSDDIRNAYLAKVKQLDPDRFEGASEEVLRAVTGSLAIVNEAWRVLGDQALRSEYDQSLNHPTSSAGVHVHEPVPGNDTLTGGDSMPSAEMFGVLPLYGVESESESIADSYGQGRHVTVPDVRGMKASEAFDTVALADLHINIVHMTDDPQPVDGTVVGQDPAAGATVRRFSTLTVEVWHPSADVAATSPS